MASSTANSDLEERPTRLTGKRDGWSFEIWVKVEDEPLKVYAEAELEEGGSEAWIASQEGKVRLSADTCPPTLTQRRGNPYLSRIIDSRMSSDAM